MYPLATNVKGQITATKTRILPNSEITPAFTNSYLISAIYYDEYLRVIQTISDNHRSGLDIVSHRINFTGDVLLTQENHTATGAPVIVQHEFSYDNAKRLTTTKHQITGQSPVTLSDNKYEELGRLKRKYLHEGSSSALQTVNYRYNIRGWLTDINDVAGLGNDKFAMKLNYKNAYSPQYNGNIASMQWNTSMFGTHTYQFVYDNANRLKFGYTTNFNTSYSYDNNGNLLTLSRQGRMGGSANYGMIDELTYDYSGNKLLAVNDVDELNHQYNGFSDNNSFATNEFTYDANGNMVSDQNKDLDMIDYNYLNLPQQINFSEGYQEINYLYTANGQKLMKQIRTENGREQTVDYIGSFVYENDQLRYILTEEGRTLAKSNGIFEYQYFLKDHLGNTRITFNQNGQIIQEDAYYPFGMAMNGLCYQSGVDYENKYLYNGKELQNDFGLDWYDYGARMYDAVIGRWHVVDPHAENYLNLTPYNYVANNPMLLVDPDGMDWFYHSTDGVSDPTWNWHDGSEYNTGVKNSDGEDVVLQGVEAVVVFEGSVDEKLGTKEKGEKGYDGKHTDGYMDGEGAQTASVTVYGPDGADDVKSYTGYTMSSDPSKYGVVNDGIYDANYDKIGKSGALKSNWTLNARGRVSTYWDNPYRPNQKDNNGNYYLTGVFIHRSNKSGWAGGSVSKGCLLISPNDWKNFNSQMNGVKNFKVQVTRTTHAPYRLPQTN